MKLMRVVCQWVAVFALSFLMSSTAYCCVGRILTVAIDQSMDQKVVATVMAIFINERTGTTVDLIPCKDLKECQTMVKNGDADIFIDYIGPASMGIEGIDKNATPQEIFSIVKHYFIREYSMVWLRPFGYHGPVYDKNDLDPEKGSLAAPVTTRRVLDQFPVLDRVINKLSGKLDDATLKKLIRDSNEGKDETVIKKFLKVRNLI